MDKYLLQRRVTADPDYKPPRQNKEAAEQQCAIRQETLQKVAANQEAAAEAARVEARAAARAASMAKATPSATLAASEVRVEG